MTVETLLVELLREQRLSGNFCDIKLSIGKQWTWAHAALLCPLSSYMNAYYNSIKLKKSSSRNISSYDNYTKIQLAGKVSQDCFDCLQNLLDLIYGKKNSIQKDHSSHIISYCELLKLSNTFTTIIHDAVNDIEHDIVKSEPFDDISELCEDNDENSMDLDVSSSENSSNEVVKPQKIVKSFDAHIKLPYGKSHDCLGCSFKCFKALDLLKHLQQTGHGGTTCSLCWTEFSNNSFLQEHLLLHDNPKPFFCTFCDMRFPWRSLLRQHLPGHISEKPYTCPHCQREFKRKHGLNCHILTHSNERKHLCDECGFSTMHARVLRAHKLRHSGDLFKCFYPDCAHTSTRKENMKEHLATHTNEKRYVCELCGLKFTVGKSLRRHSLIHNKGEQYHFCSHCTYKSKRIDNLKAHILRQHSDKVTKNEVNQISESVTVEPDVNIETVKTATNKQR